VIRLIGFNGLVNQLRELGVELKDDVLIKKLFDSLPSSWSMQCMMIKNMHNLKEISLVTSIGILESYS
jgi:hypothetical protein